MIPFDFDTSVARHGTGSSKWTRYGADVLPLWVADTDFAVAPGIVEALQKRLAHPVFGYAVAQASLREAIVVELAGRYDWRVTPEQILILPGVEPGFNMALRAFLKPGDTVAVQTPNYRPILRAPGHWQLLRLDLPLSNGGDTWQMDPDAVRGGLARAQTLLLCNPHNPTGKVFARDELELVAEACLASDTLIISDEIHCDLLFDGRVHVPIATLSPEVAARTITLMAASKTYNIAGLKTAFAVIPNEGLRTTFDAHRLGMVDSVNAFGLAATEAAYRTGGTWRDAMVGYLQGNRDALVSAVAGRMPGVKMIAPEGTFLGWLDCREAGLEMPAQRFFLDRAGVALSAGEEFDANGDGFARINFGCTRATLDMALERMAESLAAR
jgi:cystathionine beta-lyase